MSKTSTKQKPTAQRPKVVGKVRIDVRKTPEDDFTIGVPEPAGAMGHHDVALLNDVLGWEKYRLVDLTPPGVSGEGSG